jgi:hypothetical protein
VLCARCAGPWFDGYDDVDDIAVVHVLPACLGAKKSVQYVRLIIAGLACHLKISGGAETRATNGQPVGPASRLPC